MTKIREVYTTNRGVKLEHIGGWMRETWASRALGFAHPHSVRALPIERVDARRPGAKYARNHYSVQSIAEWVDKKISLPV